MTMPIGIYKHEPIPPEIRKKISDAMKGRKQSETHLKNHRIAVAKRRKRIEFVCSFCSRKVERLQCEFKKRENHFCSRHCMGAYQTKNWLGQNNPKFGKGQSKEMIIFKNKARYVLHQAIRVGLVKRLPCMNCGLEKSEGHHPNYHKPLKVIWLCRKCHMNEHKRINREQAEEAVRRMKEVLMKYHEEIGE